jgi:hypothetical protein
MSQTGRTLLLPLLLLPPPPLLLLLLQVLHEIHDQVASGVRPLQAVEAVTQQRMGPQVCAPT